MMMMGGGIINMIIWIVLLGLVIYGVMMLVMKPFEKKEDSSLNVLRERYARGEISIVLYYPLYLQLERQYPF